MAGQNTNDSKDPNVIARSAITELVPEIIHELVPRIIRETVSQIIHAIVPGIIREIVPQIVNETVPKIVHEIVPGIVRRETADIRADIKTIKHVQSQQGMMLRATQTDLNHLKTSYRQQAEGMTRLSVLLEDLEHRFLGTTELN